MLSEIFEGCVSILFWSSLVTGGFLGLMMFYTVLYGLPLTIIYFSYKKIKSLITKTKSE